MENPPSTTGDIFILGDFLATNDLKVTLSCCKVKNFNFQEVEIYLEIILKSFCQQTAL